MNTPALKRLVLVVCALAALLTVNARAEQVSVNAVSADVTVTGDLLRATFKIEVTNKEPSAITNVFVFFEDGSSVAIGDVNADGTTVSDAVSRQVDLTDQAQTRSQPVKVTLKFSLDGQSIEMPSVLTLNVPE